MIINEDSEGKKEYLNHHYCNFTVLMIIIKIERKKKVNILF